MKTYTVSVYPFFDWLYEYFLEEYQEGSAMRTAEGLSYLWFFTMYSKYPHALPIELKGIAV